jgi:putative ABC transport system permease protein
MLMALGRMLLQLLVLGYVLTYIFAASTPWPILGVLVVMLIAA